jgi:heme acquisition protein HasR
MRILDTVEVTATAEEEQKKTIGNRSGMKKEDIERRNASHMSDLIDQISGTSVNSLYSRPEVSVGVQGIAGHGRVSQQLEGVTQNFHAFTRDFGQTGSLLIDPQFLRGIEVGRGVSSSTGALGSLGGTVGFRYVDVDDILRPGKNIGGMLRFSTGVDRYKNGEKPSGSLFLGGRSERWDWMLGTAKSENDSYRIGNHISSRDLMNDASAMNMTWYVDGIGRAAEYFHDNCRYHQVNGYAPNMSNCQFNGEQAHWLKEAAKKPLLGTQKLTESQMMRLRHYLNDAYDQRLELFASASRSGFETDQQPTIGIDPTLNPGSDAAWSDHAWSVRAALKSQVFSLKYSGAFSQWLNPEVQIYHEDQDRRQRWDGYMGSGADGQPLHYFVDVASSGLKLSNASHFEAPLLGALRLDAGVELRRADKKVDSLTENQYHVWYLQGLGYADAKPMTFDPDSRSHTKGLSLALSTENKGPWQASVGVGVQRHKLEVLNPTFESGNVRQAGTVYARNYYEHIARANNYDNYIAYYTSIMCPNGDPSKTETRPDRANWNACEMRPDSSGRSYNMNHILEAAQARIAEDTTALYTAGNADAFAELYFNGTASASRIVEEKHEHEWTLTSANFALQYTPPGTGLSVYVQAGYSERAPTSNEMYMYGQMYKGYFNANPDLEPENNLSFQLGLNYQRENWLTYRDRFDLGINLYRNRIQNYIVYGSIVQANRAISISLKGTGAVTGSASVNNIEPFIRQGMELNLGYRHPAFYVRGNLTVPFRHDNKLCNWQAPGGAYYSTANPDGSVTYTPFDGKGERICASGWNWAEAGAIEPIRGSLTAALTPLGGKLELGGTVHYRGKQRAVYWYDKDRQGAIDLANQQQYSKEGVPEKDQFIEAYLWPRVIKLDLFVNYQLSKQIKAGLYLANATDQMDATTTTWGYNFYPGRTLTATLEYRF